MMSYGVVETTNSNLFTYISDLVEDSGSSRRSRSTSMDNQPFLEEETIPLAFPVMQ